MQSSLLKFPHGSTFDFESLKQESMKREEESRRHEHMKALMSTVPALFCGKSWDDFYLDYPQQGVATPSVSEFTV